MKPMIKTDKCVRELDNVLGGISPVIFDEIWFDKNKILRGLTRMRALLGYTICPIVAIKVDSFDNKEAALVWMKEHQLWTGEPYFDEVWNVLQREVITTTDLEYEFIENCPDLDSIPQNLNITRVKFKEILSSLPNEDTYSLRNLLSGSNNNIYSQKIKELESTGIITASEAKEILEHIGVIISNLHNIARSIVWKYNQLKEMAGENKNSNKVVSQTIYTGVYIGENSSANISDSQIVTGDHNTLALNQSSKDEIAEIVSNIETLSQDIEHDRDDIATEIAKIRCELDNTIQRPKILKSALNSIKRIVERIAIKAITDKIIPLVNSALDKISDIPQ
jgi:hypothetical protein